MGLSGGRGLGSTPSSALGCGVAPVLGYPPDNGPPALSISHGIVVGVAGTFGFLLLLFTDPGVGVVGDLGDHEEVIATEGIGGLPFFAIAVDAGELSVEADPVLGVVAPDGGTDRAHSKFVRGFVAGGFGREHGFLHNENWGGDPGDETIGAPGRVVPQSILCCWE